MRTGAVGAILLLACSICGGHDGSAPPEGVRWQDLYGSYFGPTGKANCSQGTGACHATGSDLGVATSGFVCGPTSDTCWQGMTQGLAGHKALVPPGVTDATQTPLWIALYKGAPSGGALSNNMPQNLKYTFLPADLTRIQAWIQAGASNN